MATLPFSLRVVPDGGAGWHNPKVVERWIPLPEPPKEANGE